MNLMEVEVVHVVMIKLVNLAEIKALERQYDYLMLSYYQIHTEALNNNYMFVVSLKRKIRNTNY